MASTRRWSASRLNLTHDEEIHTRYFEGTRKWLRGWEAIALTETDLEAAYREAALDEESEREAHEWCEALIADGLPENDFSRPAAEGKSTLRQ